MTKSCINSLTMFGNKTHLEALKKHVGLDKNVFLFENIEPSPQELIEATKNDLLTPRLVEKFGAMNINSWRLKQWGCVKESWDVEILDESSIDEVKISQQAKEEINNIPESKREEYLNITSGINAAIGVSFKSVESPNYIITKLSEKHPDILIHYGYDSESEDVSGWVALKGGKQLGHQHYSNCLRNIRIHVEPHTEATATLLRAVSEDEDSN